MNIGSKQFGLAVLHGLIAIFLLEIVGSLIFSLILKFSSVQESGLQVIITAASFVAIFAGGFISGGKGKEKGWMLGGLTGLLYSMVIFLFQYLGYDRLFDQQQIIYHTCFMLIAMMGGILGVNMSSKSRSA
ncbi:TIGR04086 family membrane protein [Bacillus sp. DNRA2]|uniref:TIGR04086 family membrane protein n=1 Tax=Bacillus sp. DNRA2 TaxID=2723053 RepID=UPI00145EF5CB|nr:TIGR04086 family membrane protein [Bacillus sp. DNRA2]NMD70575.1 TIGR04086 family membrane protein [Bacillus sp. DNRA2]